MACLGAEEFGFSTSVLIVLGCVMMRKCHLNTCPMGIATQNEAMRRRFTGRSEYVINFFRFIASEVREILASMGYTKLEDIVGHPGLLGPSPEIRNWKSKTLDFSKILYRPGEADLFPVKNQYGNTKKMDDHLDRQLIKEANAAIKSGQKIWIEKDVTNTNRAVGTMLSSEISERYGQDGLPEDTINCIFHGAAGQSFGAFLARGITLRLEGCSNDYLGKGLSGGKIILVPPAGTTFRPEENIITGNTGLYGATSGMAFIRGVAGERFAVRNSGALAVIEGTGDHCCEYMTGGRVVVLGKTGRNFAAGMSGGVAYVLDLEGNFDYYCNKGMVELSPVEDRADVAELQEMINGHLLYTRSGMATKVLTNWEEFLPRFVKVIPFEYKKILEEEKLRRLESILRITEEERRHE